jgi:hypothetical protein
MLDGHLDDPCHLQLPAHGLQGYAKDTQKLSAFLEPLAVAQSSLSAHGLHPEPADSQAGTITACEVETHHDEEPWLAFRVPDDVVAKTAECIDIVTPDMHDANCFTKSYGKYVKGTGSVLATSNLFLLSVFSDWAHREMVSPD